MRPLLNRVTASAIDRLDRATQSSRAREAAVRFHVSGVRRTDVLLARMYFSLAALHWGSLSSDSAHCASFAAGLAHCPPAHRILDVGTGAGASAALLADRFPDADVIAVDLSRRMIAEARRRHPRPNLQYRHGAAIRLPVGDADVDLVTFHNATPEMGELRRVLAHGGHVLTASSFSPLAERAASVHGRWADCGFERVQAGDCGGGAYELFRLEPTAGSAPPI